MYFSINLYVVKFVNVLLTLCCVMNAAVCCPQCYVLPILSCVIDMLMYFHLCHMLSLLSGVISTETCHHCHVLAILSCVIIDAMIRLSLLSIMNILARAISNGNEMMFIITAMHYNQCHVLLWPSCVINNVFNNALCHQ